MEPPHGIDLASFAAISADLAEADRPVADVLATQSLTDAAWTEVTLFWAHQMGENAREAALAGAEPETALEFSEAFARAQDAKRPLVALSVGEWHALKGEIDRIGLPRALAQRALGLADYSRLIRHWAREIATKPEVARALTDLGNLDAAV